MAWLPWRAAMAEALYGPNGFYRRPEGPAGHFRTSVHASPHFAVAILHIARSAGLNTIVDVGAGRGELLRTLRRLDADIELHGVDLADRPPDLPDDITWSDRLGGYDGALLFANEWLDAVPLDVAEVTDEGLRLVEVDTVSGEDRAAGELDADDHAWLQQWWPLAGADEGDRAEIGRPRDDAWSSAIASLTSGLAIAADYGHVLAYRPSYDTIVGYREGRVVTAVPDGSCDLTAHVAVDACAAAGEAAGATDTLLTFQRHALRALGVKGSRPPVELASSDPPEYLRQLQAAGQKSELTDPGGLGRFHWLIQAVNIPIPPPLAGAEPA